jgi:apolipoprotein N-acyltransferase
LRPVWWLTWLAPLPVLLVAPRIGAWPAFWLSVLSWVLGGMNMLRYLRTAIEIPITVVLIALLVPGCVFGLAVATFRKWLRRGTLGRAAFAFPAVWVAFEYLLSVFSPNGTFGNLGYTQMNFLPLLQLASVTGIWGISFCLFLLPATVAAVLSYQGTGRQKRILAVAVGAIFAAVIGYGAWRLSTNPATRPVKIGLAGINPTALYQGRETALDLIREYSGQIGMLAAQGAQAIVLPEKIAIVSDEKAPQFDSLFGAAAGAARVTVVVGLDRGSRTRRSNEARMYSPEGALVAAYDKHHLVPHFEDVDRPGTQRTILKKPSGIWGMEICKDMDFPRLSREYGSDGVGLLLVPAWDFTLDGWLHGRMAILRGVENGFTIVRAANQGRLTVSDNRGRVLAEQSSETARVASLVAFAPVRHDDTLYTRWGDWFAWVNLAGLAAISLSGMRKRDPLHS